MSRIASAVLGVCLAGTLAAGPPKRKLVSVTVEPARIVLEGAGAARQIVVTGRYSDSTSADLTLRARFKLAQRKVVAVAKTGLVTPLAEGATTIAVSVRGGVKPKPARIPVSVSHPRQIAASFSGDVRPLLTSLGCNAASCHGARKGKGGFKLSLFGADADGDFESIVRLAQGRRVNRVEPGESLLLLKASGAVAHQGSRPLEAGSAGYRVVLEWLERGAARSQPGEPRLTALALNFDQARLRVGDSLRMLATARYSDGSERDVTREAAFQFADAQVAGPAGASAGAGAGAGAGGGAGAGASSGASLVTARAFGETAIVASYLRQTAVARILVPQPPLGTPLSKCDANNRIDELVCRKWDELGLKPSRLSSDEEFLRRVYLDAIGTLPTPAQARAFLADRGTNRRAALIDRLLERPEYADFWALKWSDLLRIKSEYPVRLWPKAVAVYYRWVHDMIARHEPYDRFARALLTSSGSNFRSGPANFFRANPSKDPQTMGETAALVFMGARLGCARCHAHPTENWTPDDNLALGAFFAKLKFKSTLEWKEEIVYSDPAGSLRHPRTREAVKPGFPGGGGPALEAGEDPRAKFADWLTAPGNPWFARAAVNRVWFWLMGRGIVEEPDDLRSTNPPENPALLDYLAGELASHHYDLVHVYRLILNSRTYQLASEPLEANQWDHRHFSHHLVRRMSAEQMLDAVSQTTDTWEKFSSRIPEPASNWPAGFRAIQVSDGNTDCTFLDLFGRPTRDTAYESDRDSEASLRQALYFLNSEQFAGKISGSPRLKRMLAEHPDDAGLADEMYLSLLGRFPGAAEKRKALEYLAAHRGGGARAEAAGDLLWALVNSKAFWFIQ